MILTLAIGNYLISKIIIKHLKGMGIEINKTLEGKI